MKIAAVILAAGCGSRMGAGKNKLLLSLGGKTVIEKTLDVFAACKEIDPIVLAYHENDLAFCNLLPQAYPNLLLAQGGVSRTQSVKKALNLVPDDCDLVLIHDGARPFVTPEIIRNCIGCCQKYGSAVCTVAMTDTLALVSEDGGIESYPKRESCRIVQTPQGFRLKEIRYAYDCISDTESYTDDSSLYAKWISKPHYCAGSLSNRKITFMEDLSSMNVPSYRIGTAEDLHVFAEGRKLILGGVEIPHVKGLKGHSDADVLTHAVMGALLSGADERDIGFHFPDSDPKYKNISSMRLLDEVMRLLAKKHAELVNLSAVIICDRPKLSEHIPQMKRSLADALHTLPENVNLSATTTEGTAPDTIRVTASALLQRG